MRNKLEGLRRWVARRGFLMRLTAGSIALVLLLLAGMLVLYGHVRRTQQEGYRAELELAFARNCAYVEAALYRVHLNALLWLRNDSILSNLRAYDALTLENRLHLPSVVKLLANLQTSMDVAAGCFATADGLHFYTGTGIYDAENFLGAYHVYDRYDRAHWAAFYAQGASVETLDAAMLTTPSGSRTVIPLGLAAYTSHGHILLVMDIDVEALLREAAGTIPTAGQTFAIAQDGHVVLARGMAAADAQAAIDGTGQQALTVKARPCAFGISVVMLTDEVALAAETGRAYGPVTTYIVALFAGVFFLCIVLILRLYSPIRSLHRLVSERRGGGKLPEGKQDELTFIGAQVLSSLEREDAPRPPAEQLTAAYDDALLAACFNSRFHAYFRRNEDTLRQRFGFDRPGFCCVYACLTGAPVGADEGIEEMLASLVTGPMRALKRRAGECVLVVNLEEASVAGLVEALGRLRGLLRYESGGTAIAVGVGRWIGALADLGQSLEGAESAAYLCEDGQSSVCVAYAGDISFAAHAPLYETDLRKLQNALSTGRMDVAQEVVCTIAEGGRQQNLLLSRQRELIYDLYKVGRRVLEERGIDVQDVIDHEAEAYFITLPRRDERYRHMLDALLRFFYSICEAQTPAAGADRSGALVSQVETYIRAHYKEDIYLENIAECFRVPYKQLSRLFKAKTGERITDYIARTRIEAAKELLHTTDESINKLGERVGLPSRSTFFRLFKNYEGISPGEYRAAVRKLPNGG